MNGLEKCIQQMHVHEFNECMFKSLPEPYIEYAFGVRNPWLSSHNKYYIAPHRECGKFLDNTADDEDEKEVWVEDEDTCVDLEKTQCTVQEREAEADSEQVGEDTKEDDTAIAGQVMEDTTTTTTTVPPLTTNADEDIEVATDESAISFS